MKIGKFNVLLGADPELFVSKGGEFVSAHGMVEGTKKKPFPVKNGAVQVDGMALEFNIDPAENSLEFANNLDSVMLQLGAMVPEYNLEAVPVAHFSKEVMEAAPREALELGCEPDFNAWEGGRANPTPNGDVDFRTAAGHIHIGWTEGIDINDVGHVEACILLAKQLDFYLGLPSILLDPDNKRRELYGKAGAFRVKTYGMEYRVLSNFWLKDRSLMRWVHTNTMEAFSNLLNNGGRPRYGPHTENIINESGRKESVKLIKLFGLHMPPKVLIKGLL